MKKSNLPSKTCPVCQRPFNWRRKWQRDWEAVIYCSERCRRNRSRGAVSAPTAQHRGAGEARSERGSP